MSYYGGSLNSPSEIIPGIWIGSETSSQDWEFINTHNIGAILNITPDIPNRFISNAIPEEFNSDSEDHDPEEEYEDVNHIEYLRANIDDSLQDDDIQLMSLYLPHLVSFVHMQHYLKERNVLIHCHAGIQRSPTVVAAYLMKYYNKTYNEATKFIYSKRSIAFNDGFSVNFKKSLKEYEQSLG